MRIVLDAQVMVAAMRSDRGASRQLLLAALDRRVVLLASVPPMLEYEAVLTRPASRPARWARCSTLWRVWRRRCR
jgi:predicted nucleic acid-binding protein